MFVFNILFVLFCATSIRGETEVCATSDSECLTERINEHMEEIVEGSEGEWGTLDPLTKDVIEGSTDKLTSKFTNVVVTGFKNCKKADLVFEANEDGKSGTFSYNIICSDLFGEGDYTVKGAIGDLEVEGEGHATATLTDYVFYFSGTYTTSLDDNEETHLSLTYDPLTINSNGKPQYTWTDLASGDAEKTQEIQDKLNNEEVSSLNTEITEAHLTVMLTDVYEPTCNDYLKARSYENIFSYETS